MCTVLLAYKMIPGWPVVVGNNRDEFFQRRALPPRVYVSSENSRLRWLASCDLSGGGSWWGYNNQGLLVWLTNRWTGDESDEGRRSRGDLVTGLLYCRDFAGARDYLENICDSAEFNPFNLMVVSREQAFSASNFPDLHFISLAAGFHYLGNAELDDFSSVKARRAQELFSDCSKKNNLAEILRLFQRGLRTSLPNDSIPPQGFNVSFAGYGTTSSLLLAVPGIAGDHIIFKYCDANPLNENYRDYSKLGLLL